MEFFYFKSLKWKIIFFIIIITSVVFGIYKAHIDMQKEEEISKQYPLIKSNDETEIYGILESFSMKHNFTRITLTDGKKYGIAWAYNRNYDPPYMFDFLDYGDLLIKESYCDTLWVISDDEVFYFVLYNDIGE